ncbi:hypothetical protein T484DRAFT_1983415 [Baffinella frigidus]|nr:hypothetical protein T484DRAFT_1983415 [Cryptophyta sp. CCMP2293]
MVACCFRFPFSPVNVIPFFSRKRHPYFFFRGSPGVREILFPPGTAGASPTTSPHRPSIHPP